MTGDHLAKTTKRRAAAAVVILAVGLAVAVAAPIVGGDAFLLRALSWRTILIPNAAGPAERVVNDLPVRIVMRGTWVHGGLSSSAPKGLVSLVASDPGWLAATVALVAIPLWFWWWRRSVMSFARGIGVLASAGATAALLALTWPAPEFCAAHVLVAAPVAYLAAFLVAPGR